MRCERCPACRRTSYEYGDYECYAGVNDDEMKEYQNGEYGCTFHWKTIQKRIHQHDSCYEISVADAQRLCNPEKYAEVLEKANAQKYLEDAKHCIGLDRHNPYKRNGKLYYRPYRNRFYIHYNNPIWSDLRWLGFAECEKKYWEVKEDDLVLFWLNEDGRKWLAEKLGIFKIWEEID